MVIAKFHNFFLFKIYTNFLMWVKLKITEFFLRFINILKSKFKMNTIKLLKKTKIE